MDKLGKSHSESLPGPETSVIDRQIFEMHNNARMGWGSQVVRWTVGGPQIAMETLLLLNNTFALDGHSPCSYGGLLGCLGLFSGPSSEKSIFLYACATCSEVQSNICATISL